MDNCDVTVKYEFVNHLFLKTRIFILNRYIYKDIVSVCCTVYMYQAVITYTYIHNIISKYVCSNYKHEQTIAILNTISL